MKKFYVLMLFMLLKSMCHAQPDTVLFNALGNYNFNLLYSGYTPLIDRLGRPYVYLATKELGVVTFDISNTSSLLPIDTIPKTTLNNLKATGVAQKGQFLFVSLGDFEGAGETAGLAIFDITNPSVPVMVDEWDSTYFDKGTSSVLLDGDYAYLSAMADGVLILDVSNPQNIQFVSQIIPDTNFGFHHGTYHARGLFISNDTLLVAYDNGGLRIIDVTNKQFPAEVGMYVNSAIDSIGRAYYNHIYRIGNTAWCAVDFCGIETVNVSDASAMQNIAWLNPWNCTNIPFPFGSWNGSDGHTNEIAYDAQHNILFFSGGDSQVLAIDAGNPSQPQIIGAFGMPDDSVGSWGVDAFNNMIAIANLHTVGFPFVSLVGGLQLLSYQVITGIEQFQHSNDIKLYPNPTKSLLSISGLHFSPGDEITVTNVLGNRVLTLTISEHALKQNIDISKLSKGVYFLLLKTSKNCISTKFIKG